MILAPPAFEFSLARVHENFSHDSSYFEHYLPTGILLPGTSPEDGIFNSAQNPHDHRGIGAGLLPPEDSGSDDDFLAPHT